MKSHEWEVIVADDGSGPDTSVVINQWRANFPCALLHVWHEDLGFRLAAIRNLSAIQARGDWFVFLDGDCIPFPDFVQQHSLLSEPGWFIAGNRVLLSESFTKELLNSNDPCAPIHWPHFSWVLAKLRGQSNRALPWLRLGLGPFRRQRANQWKILKGCNIGVSKQDFMAVNGFDETYSGWGREDSDFAIRLIRHGSQLKDGRYAVPVLHLWHRENDRSQLNDNDERLSEVLNASRIRAIVGTDRHLLQHVSQKASSPTASYDPP